MLAFACIHNDCMLPPIRAVELEVLHKSMVVDVKNKEGLEEDTDPWSRSQIAWGLEPIKLVPVPYTTCMRVLRALVFCRHEDVVWSSSLEPNF